MRPAIFFDRDGTLAHEVGYINHIARFQLYPFAVEAVRAVNRAGWAAVVVTNQAGTARGYFPESQIQEVHALLARTMEEGGARLDGIYYCPHHPSAGEPPYRQDCDCRKPRPGMLQRAARELELDLGRSWMIGDRPSDVETGWAVGARGVLVRTGYGEGEILHGPGWTRPPDRIETDAFAAVTAILAGGAA